MTSFLEKLNGKLNGKGRPIGSDRSLPEKLNGLTDLKKTPAASPEPTEEESASLHKLDIDVYQSPKSIIVFAQASGVDPAEFDVTLDEENDVLTIRGSRKRPDFERTTNASGEPDGRFIAQECAWEPFFRKIVLPQEVDVLKTEAIFRKGVLMITLPILRPSEGRKLKVVEMMSAVPQPTPKSNPNPTP